MTPAALLSAREKGLRPDGWVTISLIGDVPDTVPLDGPPDRLDLRGFVDLDVIVIHSGRQIPRTVEIADALVKANVRNLELLDVVSKSCVCVISYGEKFITEVPCI